MEHCEGYSVLPHVGQGVAPQRQPQSAHGSLAIKFTSSRKYELNVTGPGLFAGNRAFGQSFREPHHLSSEILQGCDLAVEFVQAFLDHHGGMPARAVALGTNGEKLADVFQFQS